MLRQLNSCVRKPPSAGPSATPIVPASAHTRIACSSLPRIPTSTGIAPDERERGTKALKRASDDQHLERASRAHTTATPPRTRPNRSPREHVRARVRSNARMPIAPTTIARLYAVIVHETVTIDTSNVPYSAGSARTTTEESATASATASATTATNRRSLAAGDHFAKRTRPALLYSKDAKQSSASAVSPPTRGAGKLMVQGRRPDPSNVRCRFGASSRSCASVT